MLESRLGDAGTAETSESSEPIGASGQNQEEANRESSIERLLAGQPEPHYPHAFEPRNVASVSGIGDSVDSGAGKTCSA